MCHSLILSLCSYAYLCLRLFPLTTGLIYWAFVPSCFATVVPLCGEATSFSVFLSVDSHIVVSCPLFQTADTHTLLCDVVLLEYVGLFASISEGGLPDQEVNILLILFLFSVFSLFLFFDTVSHTVGQAASESHGTCPSRRLDSGRISSVVSRFQCDGDGVAVSFSPLPLRRSILFLLGPQWPPFLSLLLYSWPSTVPGLSALHHVFVAIFSLKKLKIISLRSKWKPKLLDYNSDSITDKSSKVFHTFLLFSHQETVWLSSFLYLVVSPWRTSSYGLSFSENTCSKDWQAGSAGKGAAKPDDLSWVLGPPPLEGEHQLPCPVLCLPYISETQAHMCSHAVNQWEKLRESCSKYSQNFVIFVSWGIFWVWYSFNKLISLIKQESMSRRRRKNI